MIYPRCLFAYAQCVAVDIPRTERVKCASEQEFCFRRTRGGTDGSGGTVSRAHVRCDAWQAHAAGAQALFFSETPFSLEELCAISKSYILMVSH